MRELPEGWEWTISGDVCSSVRDGTHDTPKYLDNGIPLITSKNLKSGKIDFSTAKLISINDHQQISVRSGVDDGDILFAMIGTIGNPVIVNKEKPFSIKNVALFKKNPSIVESRYLRYWLSSYSLERILEEDKFIKGTTQKFIPLNNLRNLPIPLLPLNEQKRIADRLDQLLTRIDKIKAHLDRILPLLKRFRQSVLAAATSGKLTEEWREEYVIEKLGLNSIAELKLNDDYLFDLPAGWKWVKLTDIANYKSGVAFKSNEFSNSGTQVIRLGNVYQGKLDLSRDPIFMKVVSDKANTLRSKSIVVSQTGTRHKRDYGYFVMIPEDAPPLLLNQRSLAIMTSPATIAKYVVLASNTIAYKEFFFSQETGGVNQGNVGIAGVMQGPIPLPPIKEQQEIVRRVEALFAKADRIEAQYKNARQQVDRLTPALLAKAFRGELVPQDPNDEPASVLLERVKEARSM